jgi:pilus biogenesis lipoprotein CpaD
MLFVVLLGAALLTGLAPFHAGRVPLAMLWLPAFGYSSLGLSLLSGWTLRPGDRTRWSLHNIGATVASLGEGAFSVRIAGPDPENGDAASTAQAAADQLRSLGVASDHITFGRYDAPQAGGPVQVAYNAFIAIGPNCKKGWDDFSATGDNKVTLHFGCATASNLAVMIADPRDLQRPAAETSADATRRINVLNKYRKGETTSASKDEQASGSVSQSVK